jgi:hypothetical protein
MTQSLDNSSVSPRLNIQSRGCIAQHRNHANGVTANEIKMFVNKFAWQLEARILLKVDGCERDPIALPGEKSLNQALGQHFAGAWLGFL